MSPSSSPSGSASPPLEVCAANGEAIQCPTLQSTTTQDVFESVVKGRKSWKLRGGEVVWPPELEAALLEGLENYKPDDSRETRLLGRFPMRNRIISDYIYKKTGKRRSAKQVGSRLQQLRDTCGGKRLLKLLSPIQKPPFPAHRRTSVADLPSLCFDSASETSSEPNTPIEGSGDSFDTGMVGSRSSLRHAYIYVDILPEDGSFSGVAEQPQLHPHSSSHSHHQHLMDEFHDHSEDELMTPTGADSLGHQNPQVLRFSRKPRPLSNIDPTITFVSRGAISARSVFNVMLGGDCVFSETVGLIQRNLPRVPDSNSLPPDLDSSSVLYSCPLAPGFWKSLRSSPDPTRYTITQDVFEQSPFNSSTPTASSLVYSATYRFCFPPGYSPPATTSYRDPVFMMDSPGCHGHSAQVGPTTHGPFLGPLDYSHQSAPAIVKPPPSFYSGFDSMMAPHPGPVNFHQHGSVAAASSSSAISSSPMMGHAPTLYDHQLVDPSGSMQWRTGTPPPSSSASSTAPHSPPINNSVGLGCFPTEFSQYVM